MGWRLKKCFKFSNGTSPQGQQLCQIVLKSMHYCTSYGPDKSGWTHAHTPNKIVRTMSRLPASRLDKNHHSEALRCISIINLINQKIAVHLTKCFMQGNLGVTLKCGMSGPFLQNKGLGNLHSCALSWKMWNRGGDR